MIQVRGNPNGWLSPSGILALTNNLKQLMKAKGFTQTDIAKVLGVSQGYVSDLVNKKKNIKKDQMSKLTKLFGVTPGDIVPNLRSENG